MRIAYISYPAFADCDYPLVRALREQGNEVRYYLIITPFHLHSTLIDIAQFRTCFDIVPGDAYPELQRYDSYLDSSSIRVVNFGGNSKWQVFRLWKRFHRELKKARTDIIQLTHFFPPHALYFYLTFRNKLFITIHDPVHHSGEYSRRDALLRRIGASSMRGFIFLSYNEKLIQAFTEQHHIPESKVHYAALAPYDCLKFIRRHPARQPSDFLFIGRISPYKGIDTLLEAMAILCKKRPDAKLIIAGAGDFWFDLSPFREMSGLRIINRFITPSELVALMADSQYVVCPYREGTQSGVVMSALALGRPVIASEVGNFSTIIKTGINGMLVPPSDPAALAEAMEAALEPSKRESLMEYFSAVDYSKDWERIAAMYIDAYKNDGEKPILPNG